MATYATVPQVIVALGKLGPRVQTNASVDLAQQLDMAHAEVLDRLGDVYGLTVPTFAGDGLSVVQWAEAKLCAANVLDILRAALGDESEIPERLRRSAWETLSRGVPGYRPGDPSPVDGTVPAPPTTTGWPAHSSDAPVSNFLDPYLDPYPVIEPGRVWVW